MPFDLLVAHVEVGAACGLSLEQSAAHEQQVWRSVSGSIEPAQFLSLPLEDLYLSSSDAQQSDTSGRAARRQRLASLIQVRPCSIIPRDQGCLLN